MKTFRLLATLAGVAALLRPLGACTQLPKEAYRGYPGPARPPASIATIDLGDASWAKIEYLNAGRSKYETIEISPGVYQLEWGRVFAVSALIEPSGFAEWRNRATVTLEAGHRYRLGADRTIGPGYRAFLWIEDVTEQRVVAGPKIP